MSPTEIILVFFLLAFLSELIGTLSGFGSSVFFVPLAGMLYDLQTTLVLTGILHIFSTVSQVYLFRKSIDWKVLLKVGVPSVVMVLIGAMLNKTADLKFAELAMGIFLIAFAVFFFVKPNLLVKPTTANAIVGGGASGFLAGFIGTGGAIRGATLTAFGLAKNAFVGTSAGIDFGVDFSRTMVYIANGYLGKTFLWFIPVLLVLAYAGSWAGKWLLDKVPEKIFKKIVLAMIFSIGVLMIYGIVFGKTVIK